MRITASQLRRIIKEEVATFYGMHAAGDKKQYFKNVGGIEKIIPRSEYEDYMSQFSSTGSGGSPGEIDISGPDVEMTSNRAKFTLQWSTDVAELRSDLQKAVRWLARLSPTSKLDFSAANGLYILAYDDAEADVEGPDVSIKWSRTPSAMVKSLNKIIAFLDTNADKFMRGEVD